MWTVVELSQNDPMPSLCTYVKNIQVAEKAGI
jgi:hypothetical protein